LLTLFSYTSCCDAEQPPSECCPSMSRMPLFFPFPFFSHILLFPQILIFSSILPFPNTRLYFNALLFLRILFFSCPSHSRPTPMADRLFSHLLFPLSVSPLHTSLRPTPRLTEYSCFLLVLSLIFIILFLQARFFSCLTSALLVPFCTYLPAQRLWRIEY
jgi:hypothetical protein